MRTTAAEGAGREAAFIASLRARGLRATPQRVVLHRILRGIHGHVTAEELLARASRQLPSLSLPTIYAALALLEEMGEVRRVSALGGTALYDTRRVPHHHVVCRVCGRVRDLQAEAQTDAVIQAAAAAGFASLAAQVTVQGVCPECSTRAPETAAAG